MGPVQTLIYGCSRVWEARDKRTDGLPLTESPLTSVLICLAYLLAAKILGPKLMANRPPYDLRGALVTYNAFQIVFNGWMFYRICCVTWLKGYNLICQPVDYSDNEDALQAISMGYFYCVSKLIDLLDTLFFVLRKKENHLTFLHIYHHVCMLLTVWIGFRFISGGQSAFLPTVNTLMNIGVHFYYLIAAMGPSFRKYLWWKKYLTVFQMFELACIGLHGSQLLFVDCGFPSAISWYYVVQTSIFLLLFKNFHSKKYPTNNNLQCRSKMN
ncbi:LOW QUALITY PROTEIN: elongation of very long chain fatty acids protein AAEL008004 [Daphnia magna]|uniref:LOW QUALITY PROTEIN: elongation of very long chain fatty acids protein AAEL008004 n=1 Tax=Daphnia magna TaxID=35525 RepID=UPI001E1BDA9D|nr:LOW QUALITY PROTEIN: elongation of very long chain fatty acids protein AAEL008004 [Daphnia magna]